MSSKRAIRRKMCIRKKRHPDAAGAKRHAHLLFKKDAQYMRPYKCKFCGGWHVGHYAVGRGL